MAGRAMILGFMAGQMKVDPQQYVFLMVRKRRECKQKTLECEGSSATTYKTFCGVVHETELESLLIEERLGQRPSQGIRR